MVAAGQTSTSIHAAKLANLMKPPIITNQALTQSPHPDIGQPLEQHASSQISHCTISEKSRHKAWKIAMFCMHGTRRKQAFCICLQQICVCCCCCCCFFICQVMPILSEVSLSTKQHRFGSEISGKTPTRVSVVVTSTGRCW